MPDVGQKGIQDFTVQESVAPYCKAVVSTTNAMDPCRAIYCKTDGGYVLTMNGEDVTFNNMLAGTIYELSITKSNSANIIHLY